MNIVVESLATLSWLQTRVTLRALDPLQLPPYKGSTLRGGFGTAFKETVCVVDHRDCHCGAELDLDFRGLIAAAEEVETVTSDLRWYDWERYSVRQDTRMKLGGVVGRGTYKGDLQSFLPLLHLGEVVHVGKGTSFGLGKYEIERAERGDR